MFLNRKYLVIVLGIFLYCSFPILAHKGLKKDSIPQYKQVRNFMITPYVAPSYTPELELMLTAGALMSFKIQPENKTLGRSSIPFSMGYSTNNSMAISASPFLYGKDDKYRVLARFYYRDMPDNYWGVGFDEGDRTSIENETTRYHRQWISFKGKLIKKITGKLFLGLTFDINSTKASALNENMLNDPYVLKYGTNISNVGLGAVLEYDKRDNVQNAYKGYLLSIAVAEYNKIINLMGHEFTKLTFDVRKYFSVAKRKTLALQLKSVFADGNVPWTELPILGTQFDLRGYQSGRFRDQSSLFSLVEYRHMFNRKKINRKGNYESRFGVVAWGGLGSVAPAYAKIKKWLTNYGAGFRYEIQPRLNVRIDYGFGKDNNALYISIREAF